VSSPTRELVAEWYARGASNEAPQPVSEIHDAYYRRKLESGLTSRSSDYTANWSAEDNEYSVTPQMLGGEYTVAYVEFIDHEATDDEDLSDTGGEPIYEEDLSYDLVAEVEEFVREVAEIAGLTDRERQVVEWIASGNSVVGDYSPRMSQALGFSALAARKYKERALAKLREHWAGDLDAQGYVDPRYLEPKRADEFVCSSCHLLYHHNHRTAAGVCTECSPSDR
jgi:DNA-binding CsgD family transcriptional regulator